MPEWVRSIANSLREYVANRRYARRYEVRVPFSVSIFDPKQHAASAEAGAVSPPPSLRGHTLDISATGVGLLVPTIRIGDRYLTGEGRALRVALEFPSGEMILRVVPARYERLEQEGAETGYLIGARITVIGDTDRTRLLEYLQKQGMKAEARDEG